MRVLYRSVAVAALLASGSSMALAESSYGPYIGGYGSYSFPGDIDVDGNVNGNATPDRGKLELENGYGAGVLFGYDYGAFKAEADIGYRRYDDDIYSNAVIDNVSVGKFAADGETGLLTTMFNVLYEFENDSRFTPYVGAGVGAGWIFADGGNDAGFAYQGIVGAKIGLDDQLAAFVDYRYLATTNVQAGAVDGSLATQNIQAGLVYTFTTYDPPPPPVPAPEAAAVPDAALARSFVVFFDWNSSAITPEAGSIIRDAAQSSQTLGTSRIELTGHADRSGSPGYNQALSLRRANAVKAELIALGLSEADITTVGKGESAPLVPTPDGVREPQNRRVEIVLP